MGEISGPRDFTVSIVRNAYGSEVSVKDVGESIADDGLGRVFDPFFSIKESVCYGIDDLQELS